MRKSRTVKLLVGFSLLFVVILALSVKVFASPNIKILMNNANMASTNNTISPRRLSLSVTPSVVSMQFTTPTPLVVPRQFATQTPSAMPTQTPTAMLTQTPSAVPTQTSMAVPTKTPTAVPTQPATPMPPPPATKIDRYFPQGTAVDAMKSAAANLTKQQVKLLIEQHVDALWGVIQSKLGFSTKEKAYAFFLGIATRESTFNAALETGSGPSHSYGPLQVAETAYANANANYAPETDVPEILQYDFRPQNFYDPGIAVHMGIRHLLHFSNQAKAAGYTGSELLRHALIGYNTGVIEISNQDWMRQYSDEIGALAGWYLNTGHLYDTAFSWTGSPDVDRSNPWGWY